MGDLRVKSLAWFWVFNLKNNKTNENRYSRKTVFPGTAMTIYNFQIGPSHPPNYTQSKVLSLVECLSYE